MRRLYRKAASGIPTIGLRDSSILANDQFDKWLEGALQNADWCRAFLEALKLKGITYNFDVFQADHESLKMVIIAIFEDLQRQEMH